MGAARIGYEFFDTDSPERVLELSKGRYRGLFQWECVKQICELLRPIDLKGKVVLEVGAGAGEFVLEFLRQGAKVALIELRPTMLEAIRERVAICGFDPAALLCSVGSFTKAELPVEKCDLLFVKDVIEHIRDEGAMWRRIGALVRPGGYFVATTHNSHSLNYVIQAPYERFIKGNRNWLGWDPTHVRFYNPRRLRAALEAHGFREVSFVSTHYVPFTFVRPLRRFRPLVNPPDLCEVGIERFVSQVRRSLGLAQRLIVALDLMGLNSHWPFNRMGWSLGVRARKVE